MNKTCPSPSLVLQHAILQVNHPIIQLCLSLQLEVTGKQYHLETMKITENKV